MTRFKRFMVLVVKPYSFSLWCYSRIQTMVDAYSDRFLVAFVRVPRSTYIFLVLVIHPLVPTAVHRRKINSLLFETLLALTSLGILFLTHNAFDLFYVYNLNFVVIYFFIFEFLSKP